MTRALLGVIEGAENPLEKLRRMGMKVEVTDSGEVRTIGKKDREVNKSSNIIIDKYGDGKNDE